MINTNKVELVGRIATRYLLDHEYNNGKYYQFLLETSGAGGYEHTFPILVSDCVVNVRENHINKMVYIRGAYRSYTTWPGHKTNLLLYVSPEEMRFAECETSMNRITLEGFVCNRPECTVDESGTAVARMLMAVNRHAGKADYVPCIAYGDNARCAEGFDSGDLICVSGSVEERKTNPKDSVISSYEVKIDSVKLGLIYASGPDCEAIYSYRRWVAALDVDREWIGIIPAYEVYSYYVGYCNHNKFRSMSKDLFYKTMINDYHLGNTV